MSAATCPSCRKQVDLDPAKCPYCTVIQPNRAVDLENHRLWTLAFALVAVIAGFAGGFASARLSGAGMRLVASPLP